MEPLEASPEEVRRKWDALLNVINSASLDGADAGAAPTRAAEPSEAARDLLQQSQSLRSSRTNPLRARKRSEWDDRHTLLYSAVNARMHKNVRAYFDRPRLQEQYGLAHRDVLRNTW